MCSGVAGTGGKAAEIFMRAAPVRIRMRHRRRRRPTKETKSQALSLLQQQAVGNDVGRRGVQSGVAHGTAIPSTDARQYWMRARHALVVNLGTARAMNEPRNAAQGVTAFRVSEFLQPWL